MNTFPLLKEALKKIGCPAEPVIYTGNADAYIVYTEADNRPTLYGDDTDIEDTAIVLVHYYTKNIHRIRPMQAKIKMALRSMQFVILGMEGPFLEDDSAFFHAIIRASIDGAPDNSYEEEG